MVIYIYIYRGGYIGTTIGVCKGDARSLDYSLSGLASGGLGFIAWASGFWVWVWV